MTYKEHRSGAGYLYDYFEGHQDVSHGMFSTADINMGVACEAYAHISGDENNCSAEGCAEEACMEIRSSVWLAPFDFGIMQNVEIQFRPAKDEPGFLEIHVKLVRQSGEANAWRRINKSFLHHVRRQLLVWRSFDAESKLHYEKLLEEAEKRRLV